MTETFSIERRKLMRAFGAKVILTPKEARGTGMVAKAEELAKRHGWFLPRQFANPANPAYHRQTTASEILLDFAGQRLDYWVTGAGTGGTLTGVGPMLRAARPDIKVVLAEAKNAALISTGAWQPHRVQGWTPDFVPPVLDRSAYTDVELVTEEAALATAKALAQKEGIFCGISSGATFAAAVQVAQRAPAGSVLLAMLPDTGERYLSTPLFADVSDGSDPEP